MTSSEHGTRPSTRDRLKAGFAAFRERNEHVGRAIARVVGNSGVARVVSALKPAFENSRSLRWLTSESEPGFVTVDLERTRTLGPLLRATDRVLRPVESAYRTSLVYRGSNRLWAAASSNPMRVASATALVALAAIVASTGLPAEPSSVAAIILVGVATALGLFVERPKHALEESRVARTLRTVAGTPSKDRSR